MLCTRLKKGLQALTYHKKGFQKNLPLAQLQTNVPIVWGFFLYQMGTLNN